MLSTIQTREISAMIDVVIPSEVEEARGKTEGNFAGSFDSSRVRGIRSG